MSEATEQDIFAAALAAASRVKVVSGVPDDAEVAALVAGLAAVAGNTPSEPETSADCQQWTNRRRPIARMDVVEHGEDQWRWSLRR